MKTKKITRKISKASLKARQMPPLPHSTKNQSFNINNSQAAQWLSRQPEILNAIFQYYKEQEAIIYDPDTGTWSGADFPK
jgi:hypothetical protein